MLNNPVITEYFSYDHIEGCTSMVMVFIYNDEVVTITKELDDDSSEVRAEVLTQISEGFNLHRIDKVDITEFLGIKVTTRLHTIKPKVTH